MKHQPHKRFHNESKTESEDLATLSLEKLQAELRVSLEHGLTHEEAQRRLASYGYNELSEKKTSALQQFFSHFLGPIPWMIEIAVILSAIVQDWVDFAIILVLLVVNGVIGFWEEFEAGNAIAALKGQLALNARVKRDRQWMTVPARELVPGDIIHLRIGDVLPADARLLVGDSIEVDQAALTGESLPVTRESEDAVYSGSVVKRGEIDGLVYATGANTFFGKTASLVDTATIHSHFQQTILKIGNFLIATALVLVVLIVFVALYRHDSLLHILKFVLVLTVASIPVAMPAVLSATMAIGSQALAKKQAIVSRLESIEEVAGMDILCSDKTGTLTLNQLTLGEPVSLGDVTPDEVILAATLASHDFDEDPIDRAIMTGLKDKQQISNYQVTRFLPFDPVIKRTEAIITTVDGQEFKVSKGAPQVILALSGNNSEIEEFVNKTIDNFAKRGFRALGVARTNTQGNWQFLGVLPLFDPPRSDSQLVIEDLKRLGVKVKMLTGDQVAIAKETCRQLGLGSNILDAKLFSTSDTHQMGQLGDAVLEADGFGQVFPEHKYYIVEALQHRGHIVGMTGDGVNDAPALKKADVGIAVSGATDAARAAADIVLLAPGLTVIADAVRESRKIFQRMYSYVLYRIAETIDILFFLTLSILIFNFYPMTAIMIVLLALLNDGAILAIAYDKARPNNKPATWDMFVVLSVSSLIGIASVFGSFGIFYIGRELLQLNSEVLQTLVYLKLSVAGHLTIFVTRTKKSFWTERPANILLLAIFGTQTLASLVAIFGFGLMSPIGWGLAAIVWGYSLCLLFILDWVKHLGYRLFHHHPITVRKRGLHGRL
ncbi:plasma-membrane proton-efflux P-type ATPase [Aetokthonos hydrillicola Thurmond2011]|jgi:H+-transporting ATPase|uniref:Plasma-membrane proton-efflux P-type ATPase n=1 Tax=Aetokthonos hydrillicola Thurmond2011 TaxID=2712845 RepID=A0AAP5MBZ4_9CYAN|nr:plasma-membrane proton-efflux P-type ATPase [Aetokthonos hydrillicola]MBO3463894.1 plasma-membrane proton-efflux P-type ATPase [Aetokthonos hydrillicola CCALA 1050]MBW4586101.1 plasma-membrane proton-efflux P-type ATPase [Aetokthonos hydrillicola CCALA 1050]MDR9897708.1 plasma-membrane proton-efflux P-type ATPase [Aetokthonos hydrillicola Thurmond2011]